LWFADPAGRGEPDGELDECEEETFAISR